MNIEYYAKTKAEFERRFDELSKTSFCVCGYINLHDLRKGIRHFELFLNAYAYDRGASFSNVVWSVDRRKRFIVNGKPVLKIKIHKRTSMFEKYSDTYQQAMAQLNPCPKPQSP